MKSEIINFIKNRPEVIAAYGYGSGIIKQNGYTSNDDVQLDLILVVNDIKQWHLKNLELNENDYSIIGRNFFKNADTEKLKGSTGITYLSNIRENNYTFKYGTIEKYDLQNHLYYWDSFYMPGRFQKVVFPIIETDGLKEAIKINRKNALIIAAYLLNSEYLNKKELLNMICSLSYLGDTRMKFAENPNKIKNIVNGSYEELLKIYNFNTDYITKIDKDHVKIDLDTLRYNSILFPLALKKYLNYDIKRDKIRNYLEQLNKNESIEQTIKGIKTNGIIKSVDYASKKLAKKFKH